jgi:hypothetical protein
LPEGSLRTNKNEENFIRKKIHEDRIKMSY